MRSYRIPSAIFLAAFLAPTLAGAMKFPDVPATYPHHVAIEQLSDIDVIGGNPDGTFRPTDPVNRAAILKMLYIASKRAPEKSGGCFSDVASKSWYENYVCDAALQGFVQGYANVDGTKSFKPGQPVTRAEAIKMTLTVMGIPEASLAAEVQMYTDVASTDWFASYIHTALALKILPIPGQDGPLLSPNKLLERGEAAAYIWNGVLAKTVVQQQQVEEKAQAEVKEAEEKILSEIERKTQATLKVLQYEEDSLKKAQANSLAVTPPFADTRTTNGKTSFSYQFTVTDVTVLGIEAVAAPESLAGISCRLYLLGKSGFSQEYYLGFEDGKKCSLRVAVGPGDWQLQILPKTADTKYSVSAKRVQGDGNDGFSQAKLVQVGGTRTDVLGEGDLEDWYTFTVLADTKTVANGGKELLVWAIGTTSFECLVYPMSDVDLFGFKGPECGRKYVYPPGTYMVGIRHPGLVGVAQTYTLEVK